MLLEKPREITLEEDTGNKTARRGRQAKVWVPRTMDEIQEMIVEFNPRYEELNLDILQVARYDETGDLSDDEIPAWYQRELYDDWVRRIASDYHPLRRTPALVGRRADSSYWIVDGQQHTEAEKILGFKHQMCFVFDSPGTAFEAEMFSLANRGRKKVTPLELFRSDLHNNIRGAADLQQLLSTYGYRFAADKANYAISGVSWIRNAYQRYTRPIIYKAEEYSAFEFALKIHDMIFLGEKSYINEFWFVGQARFLHEISRSAGKDFKIDRYIEILNKMQLIGYENAAAGLELQARALTQRHRGAFRVNTFSYALQEKYNKTDPDIGDKTGRGRRSWATIDIFSEDGNNKTKRDGVKRRPK